MHESMHDHSWLFQQGLEELGRRLPERFPLKAYQAMEYYIGEGHSEVSIMALSAESRKFEPIYPA